MTHPSSPMRFDFLVSSERSGSNLLTRILDNHSSVCGPTPSHLVRTLVRNRHNYASLDIEHNWISLTEDVADLLSCQLGEWITTTVAVDIRRSAISRTLGDVIRAVYEVEALANGKSRLFIKENQAAQLVPFYLSTFPNCKIIHLVRDPRDMALSWKHSDNHPGAVMHASTIWNEEQNQALLLSNCLRDSNNFMTVRYEDLLSNPEKTLRLVCEHLGLDFEEQMLEFHSSDRTERNAKRLRDWTNLAKPVMKNNFNKYKNGLAESEIRWIEHICQGTMRLFGYQPDFDIDNLPEAVEREIKQIEVEILKQKKSYMSTNETEIRKRRLKVIEQILNRIPRQTPPTDGTLL